MTTAIKRVTRFDDRQIDDEFENLVRQIPNKVDVQKKLDVLDDTITIQNFTEFEDREMKFNKADNKLYIRIGEKLFSFSGTEIT